MHPSERRKIVICLKHCKKMFYGTFRPTQAAFGLILNRRSSENFDKLRPVFRRVTAIGVVPPLKRSRHTRNRSLNISE